MDKTKQIKERFLKEVANHKMNIISDSGLIRHIQFKNPDSNLYHFNITTWPWHLCVSGEMGCFVFSRIEDMFEFFQQDKKVELFKIDPYYSSKQLVGIDKDGFKYFDTQKLEDTLKAEFDNYFLLDDQEFKDLVWDEIEDQILGCTEQDDAIGALISFKSKHCEIYFDHHASSSFEDYCYGYLWCLWAITYAIQQYNAHKTQAVAA